MPGGEEVVMADAMPERTPAPEVAQTSLRQGRAEIMRYPFRCPICRGATEVEEALYLHRRPATGDGWVPCKACFATGIVWG